jgi:hypothetical protein
MTEDLHLVNYGSIALAHPRTANGRKWLRETAPDDAQFHGAALAFEPRYADNIIEAAEAYGLRVRL